MIAEPVAAIRDAILQRQRFVITSHARPDGDAIGSQVAMAYALRELGKDVQMVGADPAPPQFQVFPGVSDHPSVTDGSWTVRRGHRDGVRRPVAHGRRGVR